MALLLLATGADGVAMGVESALLPSRAVKQGDLPEVGCGRAHVGSL
jgi:hypothetical protein